LPDLPKTALPIKREKFYTRKYLKGSGNLCSRAVCINFLTRFRATYNQGRLTLEKITVGFSDSSRIDSSTLYDLTGVQVHFPLEVPRY